MGGYGSGSINRNRQGLVEDYFTLDINSLNREHRLTHGTRRPIYWNGNGVQQSVLLTGLGAHLRISYNSIARSGQTQVVDTTVVIEWTSCNLGGKRPWFRCPDCYSRVGKLHLVGHFACRKCLRLSYLSKNLTKAHRASYMISKLERSLSTDEDSTTYCKPPRMHWTTFDKHLDRIRDYERQWEIAVEISCAGALARILSSRKVYHERAPRR